MTVDEVAIAKVEIHLTDRCNNRCPFCTSGWNNAEEPLLPLLEVNTIETQLTRAWANGARRVLFQGGEPTLHPALPDLIRFAYGLGYEAVNVFSNANVAASDRGLARLVAMGVTWWQVSIQAGTAPAHDAAVGRGGAFRQTLAGTRRLLDSGERVKINAVLTVHLLETLAEFADLMVSLGPEEVGLDTVKPTAAFSAGRCRFESLVPKVSPFAADLRRALEKMRGRGVDAHVTSFPPCLIPGGEHFVSEEPDSTVTYSSWHQSLPVIKSEWKDEMRVKAPTCAECAYDPVCAGVYTLYADTYGLGELEPRTTRHSRTPERPPSSGHTAASPLTRALQALFVLPDPGLYAVTAVDPLPDNGHCLSCDTPSGELRVLLLPAGTGAAYRTTHFFSVSYQAGHERLNRDQQRMLDAIVHLLVRREKELEGVGAHPQ